MVEAVIAFAAAALLITMAPGPSTVVIMRRSIRSGRPAGVATVLGNEAGWLLWGVAAALGLSALLVASRLAYDVLRITGAVVLVFMGVRALWQARRPAQVPQDASGEGSGSLWSDFRLGLITNLANPKAGVFAVSLLPQFVPDGAPVAAMLVLFAVVATLVDLLWYMAIVWLIGGARGLLARAGVRRRLEQISGVVLVGLGIRLAAESR